MMKVPFIKIPTFLIFITLSIIFLGPTKPAFADKDLIVDARTDYLPGDEFILTRVTVEEGGVLLRTQDLPAFTIDDFIAGERVAEFSVPENRIYTVTLVLFQPNGSVLDSQSLLLDFGDTPFGTIIVLARTTPPAPACEDELAAVTVERDQCVGDLAAVTAERDQCVDTDLPACQTTLSDCQGDFDMCSTDLSTCSDMLGVCNSELAALQNDDDGDGVIAALDNCPSTPAGADVDSMGCSQEEFCSSILIVSASDNRTCRRADWKNDEPTVINRGDCDVGSLGTCVSVE